MSQEPRAIRTQRKLLRAALAQALGDLSPALQVYWEDNPAGYIDPTTRAQIILSSVASVDNTSKPDLLAPFDSDAQELARQFARAKIWTIRIRIESQSGAGDDDAFGWADEIKTLFDKSEFWSTARSEASSLSLTDLGLAYSKSLATQNLNAPGVDDRDESIAAFDCRCNLLTWTSENQNWIAIVAITGTVNETEIDTGDFTL